MPHLWWVTPTFVKTKQKKNDFVGEFVGKMLNKLLVNLSFD